MKSTSLRAFAAHTLAADRCDERVWNARALPRGPAVPLLWSRLAVAIAGVVVLALVASAEARLRPRAVGFVSVASAAEFDPLAAGDNLRAEERAFLRLALETFRRQERVAKLGVAQATRSDVRTFAQELAGNSRQMADAVETVARRKGVVLMPIEEEATPNPVYARLAGLTGEAFDREFVLVASATVEDLMDIYQKTVSDATDAEVRELAGSHLPTLRAHSNTSVVLRKAVE